MLLVIFVPTSQTLSKELDYSAMVKIAGLCVRIEGGEEVILLHVYTLL